MNAQQAWSPYEPDEQRPWDLRRAAHLLRRAGFGADWTTLQQAVADGPARTIDRLLRPPADLSAFNASLDDYALASASGNSTESLRAWWLRRMIETPYPLLEKMTLFWHGHFAIGNNGVNSAALMARHLQTLREGALGSYRSLVSAVMNDPALYLSLRTERSRKSQPGENVARQLLGAFGVGPENFDEEDVSAVARALTGRFILRNQLRFFEREYDDGTKRLLGKSGSWNADDAVRIVLEHPATAEQLVRKLYRWLISECDDPEPELLEPLVADLREHDDILRLVDTMLRSNHFFSPAAYRRRIKGPVELAVGLVRAMGVTVPTLRLGQQLAEMGQDLYRPPTSSGWSGGRDWINQVTMIARQNLTTELLATSGSYEGRLDPAGLAARHGQSQPEPAARMLADLLLDGDLPANVAEPWRQRPPRETELPQQLRQLAATLTHLPEFQLA